MTTPTENTPDSRDERLSPGRLAALTGFDDPTVRLPRPASSPIDPDTGTSEMDDEEIEAQVSRHTFASHPTTKLLVVALGVLGIAVFGGLFMYALTDGGLRGRRDDTPPPTTRAELPIDKEDDREKAELLTELALKEQEDALKSLPREKEKPKPTPAPKPKVVRESPPEPIVRTVYRSPTVRVAPPAPVPSPVPSPSPSIDPYEQWLAQSRVGSYGGTTGTNESETHNEALVLDTLEASKETEPENSVRTLSGKEILPGSRARAVLLSAISFSDGTVEGENRFIGELTEPLRSVDGSSVFPQGTRLVFELNPAEAPLVTLTPIAAIVRQGNGWVEYTLPSQALSVVSGDDRPLIAKEKRVNKGPNGFRRTFETVGQLGSALDIPGSTIPSEVYRRSAGDHGGTRRATRLYTLAAGTEVEILAVTSFSPFSDKSGLSTPTNSLSPRTSIEP